MTNQKEELIPITVRLSTEALRLLDEASHLQRTTRSGIIRLSLAETLNRWQTEDRKRIIEQLTSTI